MTLFSPTEEHKSRFERDGFLTTDRIINPTHIDALHRAFDALFHGNFETGVRPDEVNWRVDDGDPTLTRQICNGWKADRTIARTILSEALGAALAKLAGWPGVRVMLDNVLWKPPGARAIGFHQDAAYLSWLEPSDVISCWIALDTTSKYGGTIEYARGSHRFGVSAPPGEFHAPIDYKIPMIDEAKRQGIKPEIVPVLVPAGGGSIHHGRIWHGSDCNLGAAPRRALVLHAIRYDARYVPTNFAEGIGPIYSRYRRLDCNDLDENHFPILWQRNGYRTRALDAYIGSRT